jgi:hypothetical protein
MRQWLRSHLTFANVVSVIALFVAIGGGSAVALNGVNTVQSDDLGPGAQVKNPDVAANAVGTNKVIDDSLTGTDINESSLGEVPSATLGGLGGSSFTGDPCNPESTSFTTCASRFGIDLPAPSHVLIIGQIRAEPDTGGGNGGGSCGVASSLGGSHTPVPVFVNGGQTDVIAISAVTPVVGPGQISLGIQCNETASGIRYFDGRVSFVALSPG